MLKYINVNNFMQLYTKEPDPVSLGANAWGTMIYYYRLLNVEGLDPINYELNAQPNPSGGSFLSRGRATHREVVLTIELPPNHDTHGLYSWFAPGKSTDLKIGTDNGEFTTHGYIENIDRVMFSANNFIVITIICPDPFLTREVITVASAQHNTTTIRFPYLLGVGSGGPYVTQGHVFMPWELEVKFLKTSVPTSLRLNCYDHTSAASRTINISVPHPGVPARTSTWQGFRIVSNRSIRTVEQTTYDSAGTTIISTISLSYEARGSMFNLLNNVSGATDRYIYFVIPGTNPGSFSGTLKYTPQWIGI